MTLRELSSNWCGGNFNLQGGAIAIYGGSLIIQDSTFERNEAFGDDVLDGVSGPVFLYSARTLSELALCCM